MSLREPVVIVNRVGETSFNLVDEGLTDSWEGNQEFVFLNGMRLVGEIAGITRDYSVVRTEASTPADEFDTIVLSSPLTDATDLLQIQIVDPDTIPSDLDAKLDDILTAVTGSWVWNKSTGILTMIDSFGQDRFKFEVMDTSDMASRERRSDLEA